MKTGSTAVPRPTLRTTEQIDAMRPAGRLVAEAIQLASAAVRPGVTTGELDRLIAELFSRHGAIPLFKNYPHPQGQMPFPAVTCISVNEEVVHGIPGPRVLQQGDVVKIDTGCKLNGWCGDSAVTVAVGAVPAEVTNLLKATEDSLWLAIRELGRRTWWSEIAGQMQSHIAAAGFAMVEQMVGHGIGRVLHEPPQVPNVTGPKWTKEDFRLEPGLVLAIEPIANQGSKDVKSLNDFWTVATMDGQASAHFEHTVALTPDGPVVLTARQAGH